MGRKNETVQIKQIAEKLNLSQGTVSLVLNGRGDEMRISKATQKLVLESAKEMNYQPNIYARRLRRADSKNRRFVIAVFVNIRTTGERMSGINEGLWRAAQNKDYVIDYMLEFFEYDKLEKCDSYINSALYNGVVVIGISEADIEYLNRKEFDLPVVVMNVPGEYFSSVYVDEYQLGWECAKLFWKSGIHKAGLITQTKMNRGIRVRQTGFFQACQEYEIQIDDRWIIEAQSRNVECGYLATLELLKQPELPEALFVMSDMQAIGVVHGLREAGYRIPDEVGIICYGDNELLQSIKPTISCIHFSVVDMVEDAIKLVLELSESDVGTSMSRVRQAHFIFRDSFLKPSE